MGLTRAEQETILRWDEEEKVVHVYSASPLTWRKLARLGITPRHETKARGGDPTGKFYHIPVGQFRWGLKGRRRGNVGALQRGRQGTADSANNGPSQGAGQAPA